MRTLQRASLQATYMSASEISEVAVYSTTGQPLPADVRAILDALLNEPFSQAHARISEIKARRLAAGAFILHGCVCLQPQCTRR